MRRPRSTATAILVLLAAMAVALPATASASGNTVRIDPGGSPQRAVAYWTKARMRAAEPVPIERTDEPAPVGAVSTAGGSPTYVEPAPPGGSGAAELRTGTVGTAARGSGVATLVGDPAATKVRAHGKVFFTVIGGKQPGNYVCSGTAVNSRNKSLVLTAGHCVWDSEFNGGKSTNFVFVPAYGNGERPFGTWAAKSLATTKQWKKKANLRYDIGAVVVRRDDQGRRLQQVVGARGIGFDQPRNRTYTTFGYPAMEPFDGTLEYRCKSPGKGADAPAGNGPATMRIACDMTRGASGGGWITNNSLTSLTSYSYPSQPGFLYGPYLSATAKKLYKRMRG